MPAGIAWNDGTLYVADTFNFSKIDTTTGEVSDIERLVSELEYPTAVIASVVDLPTGVAIGSDGEIYVSSDMENSIYRITRE